MKKVALNVFVKMLDVGEIEKLSKLFMQLDKDATGMISKTYFKELIGTIQPIISEEEVNKIFAEVDRHRNEKINYTEFLVATIDIRKYLTDEKVRAIFM